MKPDEMSKYIKQIPGLDQFPINSHDDLIRQLGGKDKEIKFKDKKLKTDDILRMFPANYFPIVSQDDLTAKAVKLMDLGQNGFQAATKPKPEKESGPPARNKDLEAKSRGNDADGFPK